MDMENLDDIFAENGFLPCIGEVEVKPLPQVQPLFSRFKTR